MARKNRRFSGTSMMRYSAKVGKMMKAVSHDEAEAKNMTDMATYHFAIGQGGYHVLRSNIGLLLDQKGIPKPARVPFYALAQYIYKRIIKDNVDPRELAKQKDELVSKYFIRGTPAYKVAVEIVDEMLAGTAKPVKPVKKGAPTPKKTTAPAPAGAGGA